MNIIKKIIPRGLRQLYLPCKIAFYDWSRFARYSGMKGERGQEHLLCSITMGYHVIEKGLSMKQVRPLFGREVVINLIRRLNEYEASGYDPNDAVYQTAVQTLRAYKEYHDELSEIAHAEVPLDSVNLYFKGKGESNITNQTCGGGKRSISRETITQAIKGEFPDLIMSRHSVRHFSGEPVSEGEIAKAVEWAQRSPSACNRQCGRVIAVRDKKKIEKVLAIQGGTRGFTEDIDKLLIIAGDLRSVRSPIERNQIYCDGGLFAMTLLLGLHYQGLGACSLHWCVKPDQDRELRSLLKLEEELGIVMLIGVGSLDSSFNVAYSQRMPLSKVLLWK